MRSPTAPNLLFDLDPYYHPDAGAEKLRDEWLAFYRGHTHISYKTDLRLWFEWCALHAVTVLAARRADLEAFMRNMEDAGLKASTRQRRIAAVAGFYLHAEQEEVIARSPARFVRRPRVPDISTSAYLDRFELGRFLDQAYGKCRSPPATPTSRPPSATTAGPRSSTGIPPTSSAPMSLPDHPPARPWCP